MSFYLPFERFEQVGGPSTFMQNLKQEFQQSSYVWSSKPSEADGLLFPVTFDINQLKQFRRLKKPIIQRLDGIFYPEKHPKNHHQKNAQIRLIYHCFATHIIFQSQYSKTQVFTRFGEIPENRYSIIYNGVNKKVFNPSKSKSLELPNRIRFISTGNFRNSDMLVPVIRALKQLNKKWNFEYQIIGPISCSKCKKHINEPFIKYDGVFPSFKVSEELRNSDIFLFSSLNPPCPNAILEAISTGLPVVAFDDGSTRELLHFNNELLAKTNDRVFKREQDLNPSNFTQKIEHLLNNFRHYKNTALQNTHLFDMKDCAKNYISVIESELNSKANYPHRFPLKSHAWHLIQSQLVR